MGAVWFVKFRFNISIQFLILLSNPDGCKNWWTHKFIIFLTLYVILIIYYVNKSVFLNPSHIPISILFISSNIKYVFVVTIKPPPTFWDKATPFNGHYWCFDQKFNICMLWYSFSFPKIWFFLFFLWENPGWFCGCFCLRLYYKFYSYVIDV